MQQTSLVREVLREQVGSVGASIDARSSVMLSDGATIVSQLSDMFVRYITTVSEASLSADSEAATRMATYCPIYGGFIQLGVRGKRDKKDQKQTWMQSKYNTRELANLMGLLGPTGVRFVQVRVRARRGVRVATHHRNLITTITTLTCVACVLRGGGAGESSLVDDVVP